MATAKENLIAALKEIDAAMVPAPWSVAALYSAIRHVQRNTNVMDETQEVADEPDRSAALPGRQDGDALARLRNALPSIIAALEAQS